MKALGSLSEGVPVDIDFLHNFSRLRVFSKLLEIAVFKEFNDCLKYKP